MEEGTVLLDVTPDISTNLHSNPSFFNLESDDRVFFNSNTRLSWDQQIDGFWATDGTAAGTERLANIARFLTRVGDEYVFFAESDTRGREDLWKTDGTADGTLKIIELNVDPFRLDTLQAGNQFDQRLDLVTLGDKFFFAADVDDAGEEPWVSDGTEGGTFMLKDINPGDDGSRPVQSRLINDRLLFDAFTPELGYELWATDGTTEGTKLLRDMNEGPGFSTTPQTLSQSVDWNGELLFAARDPEALRLWRTDGTPDGTRLITPGIEVSTPIGSSAAVLDNSIWFAGRDRRMHLYRSDGTPEGTVSVKQLQSIDSDIQVVNDMLFFLARDTSAVGSELWVSDGTEVGTQLLKDVSPGRDSSAQLTPIATLGQRLIFSIIHKTQGRQLWATDGTADGTAFLKGINSFQNPHVIGDKLLFIHDDGVHGEELWVSDGSEAGTKLLNDIVPGSSSASFHREYPPHQNSPFYEGEGRLFFAVGNHESGLRLWETDGTSRGTRPISSNVSFEFSASYSNGNFFFAGHDEAYGTEPWIYAPDPPRIQGDTDLNGVVDFDDFLRLSQNFGKGDAEWEDGDFDRDRIVTFADFLALSANFRKALDDLQRSPDADAIQTPAVDSFFSTNVEDEVSNLETLQPTL